MTSKIVVNNIEPDAGISTVTVVGNVESTKFVGAVEGSVTGNVTGNLTGTASTSTNAATAYAIDSAASLNTSGIVTATSFVPTTGQLSHRNIIINGGMTIKQRADLTMTTTSTYSLDRWRAAVGSSFNWSSATVTQSTTSPDEFSKSLKVDIASTNTPTGSQNGLIQTKIEGQDLQQLAYGTSSAKQCTLSFYVRSNKTGTYCVQVTNPANSKYVLFDYTINSADTWERKSVTFSGNTANTLNDDNAIGFEINFHLATGSSDHESATSTWTTYSGGSFKSTSNQVNLFDDASNAWYLTGCQLEVGSVATPFEHRSFADELKRCQRYYYASSRWMGGSRGSSTARSFVTDFGMRLTGSQVSGGTYTNEATSGGDVVYIGSNATRQNSDVNANSLGASSTSSNGSLQLGVTVGYALGSGDNGIATGLYINGFTVDHEL